jgi:hypothetical protein
VRRAQGKAVYHNDSSTKARCRNPRPWMAGPPRAAKCEANEMTAVLCEIGGKRQDVRYVQYAVHSTRSQCGLVPPDLWLATEISTKRSISAPRPILPIAIRRPSSARAVQP